MITWNMDGQYDPYQHGQHLFNGKKNEQQKELPASPILSGLLKEIFPPLRKRQTSSAFCLATSWALRSAASAALTLASSFASLNITMGC
jgi:hypothetical protein